MSFERCFGRDCSSDVLFGRECVFKVSLVEFFEIIFGREIV